jgi:hypothetical protein
MGDLVSEENQEGIKNKDSHLYNLEMKMNSGLQVLYLNPKGNFDISVTIPGYEHSQFIEFK